MSYLIIIILILVIVLVGWSYVAARRVEKRKAEDLDLEDGQ